MGATHIDPQEFLVYNSGTITAYFSIEDSSYNSFQVSKATTGSYSAIRLETSNYMLPFGRSPYTGSNDNWRWVQDADFTTVYSGSLLTASNAPASTMFHMGNLNSRYARVIIDVGAGDVFRIVWHGKGA